MNVLICDDDIYVRKMLEKIFSENTDINKTFMASDGLDAVKIVGDNPVDIALLDIDMPNLDGIETAKILKKTVPDIEFVFITGYMEYAIDSFCVHPYDYILKPIDIDRLNDVLKELKTKRNKKLQVEINENDKRKMSVKKGHQIMLIPLDEILFFERSDRQLFLNTQDETFRINKTLTEIENELPSNTFLRTHKSFVVNKNKIKKINIVGNRSYQIVFYDTDKEAILSRHKYEEIMKYLSI